jgi:hypothetical protein
MRRRTAPAVEDEAPEIIRAFVAPHEEQALERSKLITTEGGEGDDGSVVASCSNASCPLHRLITIRRRIEAASEVGAGTPAADLNSIPYDVEVPVEERAVVQYERIILPPCRRLWGVSSPQGYLVANGSRPDTTTRELRTIFP